MRFAIVNLGCKVNRVESDSLAVALEALGFQSASAGEGSEDVHLAVVNTCTVTGEAEKKTRKAVRRALRDHPQAAVVVTGCAAAIDPDAFKAMDARVSVAGKFELGEAVKSHEGLAALVPSLEAALMSLDAHGESSRPKSMPRCAEGLPPCDAGERNASLVPEDMIRVGEGFPTRVGIKVQDGCDNACTYCIVHVARGRAWSRPASEIESEYRRLVAAGVSEVVLSGINLGTYRDGSFDLSGLLEHLLATNDDARIRISSIEPKDVSDRLIGFMACADGRIARHLHLPLQSGSTRVLKRMARPYTAEWFCELVERLYGAMPGLSLSTDVIVGFPGETEEDFRETLAAARRCRFSKIHVFPYSKRAGTPAAAWPDQVDPQVKASRAAELSELGAHLRDEAYRARIGTVERVLVETRGKGMTESYFEIPVPPEAVPGSLVAMRIPEAANLPSR
nr:tRNA (N(6)-L-threonylcarbamoyladenosine(37)-C(2))-methylthiotransferase MtaB [Raoultibacter phocaeensis]